MQTFLPYADFIESSMCLDRQRLGKQRVETMQILSILHGKIIQPSECGQGMKAYCLTIYSTFVKRGKVSAYLLAVCEQVFTLRHQ